MTGLLILRWRVYCEPSNDRVTSIVKGGLRGDGTIAVDAGDIDFSLGIDWLKGQILFFPSDCINFAVVYTAI